MMILVQNKFFIAISEKACNIDLRKRFLKSKKDFAKIPISERRRHPLEQKADHFEGGRPSGRLPDGENGYPHGRKNQNH